MGNRLSKEERTDKEKTKKKTSYLKLVFTIHDEGPERVFLEITRELEVDR